MSESHATEPILDFPSGWAIFAKTDPQQHHERCSYRTENRAMICDCAALAAAGAAWDLALERSRPALAYVAEEHPCEEDPATREWIAIPAAEAREEWAARCAEDDVSHVFAAETRAEAEQICAGWTRTYALEATVLRRFVGPWEPLEGKQDHA
jgi:hypothetical protein